MKEGTMRTVGRQRTAAAGGAGGPRMSGWVAASLFALALCGLGIATLALLAHRPTASMAIGLGAVVTGVAATVWAIAPGRVIGGGMVAIAGIATIMVGCGIA